MHVTSPVSGTIFQWRVNTTGAGQFALRVLHPTTGGKYTGAGTSAQLVSSSGAHLYTANLPIQAGDLIGLDIPDSSTVGPVGRSSATGSTFVSWIPPIADGSPSGFADPFPTQELLFNADVEYTPTPASPPSSPGTPGTPGTSPKKCKKKKKHKRSASAAKKCKKKKKKH